MSDRRSSVRRALTLGCLAATAVAWSGCSAKKQTEYVAGVSTQVQVPRDLKAIRLDVSVGGVIQFCRGYRVYDGKVQLPRSLGELPSQGTPGPDPITVTVSGFTEEFSETTGNSVFDNCTSVAPQVGNAQQGTRILRRSRQPYVADSVLFLPMPLKYSCFDFKGCEDENKTCKAGRCVDATIDEKKLPIFDESLINGLGGACFSAATCFAAAAPAVVVDPNDCTYALPNSAPSSPPQLEGAPPLPPKSGDGLNVEITYDGGLNREILDKDEAEGFMIPDAAGLPQRFRLAPGLCDMVKGYGAPDATHPEGVPTVHRITAVRVSGTCQAKGPFQPLCASDQLVAMGLDANGLSSSNPPPACKPTELRPPKAALIVLADDTKNSELFYSPTSLQSTVGLSLADPAFQKTELGLQYFPGSGTCGSPGSFALAVDPKLARIAKTDIVASLTSKGAALSPLDATVNLDGALSDAYAFLGQAKYDDYYRRAVLVLGNRDFDKTSCGSTPAQRATIAKSSKNIETYVLLLARNTQIADATVPVPMANDLAVAGGTPGAFDARKNKGPAQDAFQAVVNDLATCVYDVDTVTDPSAVRPQSGDTLSYSNPVDSSAKTTTITFNAACNAEAVAGTGFGVDPVNPKRAYLCKTSCDSYRSALRDASLYAAQYGQPPMAVPVFAHKQGCTVIATGGAGSGG